MSSVTLLPFSITSLGMIFTTASTWKREKYTVVYADNTHPHYHSGNDSMSSHVNHNIYSPADVPGGLQRDPLSVVINSS